MCFPNNPMRPQGALRERVSAAKRGCPENRGFWVTAMRSLGSGNTQALVLGVVGKWKGRIERKS